jgi:hypothetical protein
MICPLGKFHKMMSRSCPALASMCPSGEKATQ